MEVCCDSCESVECAVAGGGHRGLVVAFEADEGFGFDQFALVLLTNHSALVNRRMRGQHVFDFCRTDPEAAHFQHVVTTPRVPVKAVLVDVVTIAGEQPLSAKSLAALLVLVQIRQRD